MPRQRRGAAPARSAPSRPTVAPARPNVMPPQNKPQGARQASTVAGYPPAAAKPAQAGTQQQTPGLFGQMASTAAGVAVGSSIGHAIGGFFGGGSSSAVAPAEAEQTNMANPSDGVPSYSSNNWGPRSCDVDAKQFTKCLDENQGNMQICGWYLEQLKACQAAASNY